MSEKEACQIVEAMARAIGQDCEIIFCDDFVQVAPLGWSGYSAGSSLYAAIKGAKEDSWDYHGPDYMPGKLEADEEP